MSERAEKVFEALGQSGATFKRLETFPAPDWTREVTMESDEVTALCPATGQPDWYTVTIVYEPRHLCIESKSLKLYLQSFRNEGIFCEPLASRICEDIANATNCVSVYVNIVQKPRGGVMIDAQANMQNMDEGE